MKSVSRRRQIAGLAFALTLTAILAAACDGSTEEGATGSLQQADGPDRSDNRLRITERDYAFEIDGHLRAGTVTIEVSNQGREIHELAMARLRSGKTLDDVRAAVARTTKNADDPLRDIVVEDSTIDDLGGVQFPGTSYAITGSGIEAGDYVLLCVLPMPDGSLHAAHGMMSGFTVDDGNVTGRSEPDVTYTVTDNGIEGPSRLPSGRTVIEIVNNSSTTREINLAGLSEGKSMRDVMTFFQATGGGLPDPRRSPFDFLTFVYDAKQDRSITVELDPGQWIIGAPDPRHPSESPPDQDPFTMLLDVDQQ